MVAVAPRESFADLLERRGDPLAVCRSTPWLAQFASVPDDAAPPLAMSGPHPRAVGSYGAECIAWGKAELGITYRWWQQLAITRQLEHDEDGALVYPEVIETGPRRIGKSVRLRGTAQWRCSIGERIGEKQLAMLVSKDLAVGKEIHRGSWRWAEQKGWKVTRLGGAQEIENPADESRWLLRADTAVYGYDVGYGQVDESWGVDPQSITDGLEPAMLERLWPQLHLTSTAHVKATSLMRRRLTAALRDADPNVLLLFWGARPDTDLADPATWREASPHWTPEREALIARKYAAALAGQEEPEFDDPDPVRGWAAQYLNVWPLLFGGETGKVLPTWGELATTDAPPAPESLGVAADLERSWVSLAAYGSGYVGAVLRMPFGGRRAEFVAEVVRIANDRGIPVGVDAKGPAKVLIADLEDAGVDVRILDLEDRIQADADLREAVETKAVQHGDHDELNRDVATATWRKVGDRLLFGRSPMLEAVSIAHWIGATDEPTRDFWGAIG